MWSEFCFLALAAVPVAAQSLGILEGSVTGGGVPLANTRITAARRATNGPPSFFQGVSSSVGRYAIENLPPGDYTVCAQHTHVTRSGSRLNFWQAPEGQGAFVNPCDWEDPAAVRVGPGRTVLDLRMQTGVVVSVVLEDTSQQPGQGLPDPTLQVADAGGTVRAVLSRQASAAGLRRYAAIVPASRRYTLVIKSAGSRLRDSSGSVIYPSEFQMTFDSGTQSHTAAHFKLH